VNTTWLTLVVMCLGGVGQAVAAEVPDLWQRRGGDDWPRFLGPNGDGTSGETGFFTATGLRGAKVLWSRRIGSGYAMPSISRGRLFQFSRVGGRNRLDCLRADPDRIMCCKLLIEAGANVNIAAVGSGATPLMWAARNGNLDMVKLMVEHGANIHASQVYDTWNARSFAAQNGHTAVCNYLLDLMT
jgi:hypothetical protein